MGDKKKPLPPETARTAEGGNKTVRAMFTETVTGGIGLFERGRQYEIPESLFTEWEKAGICGKAEE
ncbi:MAG: hypothetical protein II837_04040 [Treponema sp.]|nr:hypothetical protein [Treponema sp.]MBQ7165879.1 hypothetical protein [Treponema sp.]